LVWIAMSPLSSLMSANTSKSRYIDWNRPLMPWNVMFLVVIVGALSSM
jgi:hypothetical protein